MNRLSLILGLFAATSLPLYAQVSSCLVEIKPAGMFIKDSPLMGETRANDVAPRHAVCVQLAKTRWLIVYTTRGWRGVDDERSVLYQIRKDAPDGDVIKEGFLGKAISDWRPDGVPAAPPGHSYFKQLGHAVAYGVPKGAVIDGKIAAHGNHFVVHWRVLGRVLINREDKLLGTKADSVLFEKTQAVEWLQFRLNDREDDIEITEPASTMRLKNGKLPSAQMNQTFCPPVPFNEDATDWVCCNHFDKSRLAVLKLCFNAATKRYEWVDYGPFLDAGKRPLTEASIARAGSEWIITARSNGQIAWFKSKNPFATASKPTFFKEPSVSAPHTTFLCADGIVRLFTGDKLDNAQKYDRDPLFTWELSFENGVTPKNRRVAYDSLEQKLPIRRAARPRVDFALLFPPQGRQQILIYSVTPRAYNHLYEGPMIQPATAADKAASGLYFSRLIYKDDVAPMWRFE